MILYDDDKSLYYDALAEYDKSEDISQLANFFTIQTVRTWEKSFERERRQTIKARNRGVFHERQIRIAVIRYAAAHI